MTGSALLRVVFLLAVLIGPTAWAAPADDLLASLQPTGDVNDFAGVLKREEKQALEERCRQLRERSGAQLAVVVLRSLQGGQVDDFTVKLFERWKVGQADKKNGVMLLVALNDRTARIEVGYGLEPVLPDALAGRVLQEQLFPAFRQQRYAAGLTAAVNRIAEIVERNEPAPAGNRVPIPASILYLLVSLPIVFFSSLATGVCLRRRKFGITATLLFFTAAAIFFAQMIGMPWFVWAILIVGAIAATVLGYRARVSNVWDADRWNRPGRWTSAPRWNTWDWPTSTSWSGGGFSGGGGGSSWGGFGGGSSGGGGASGSW